MTVSKTIPIGSKTKYFITGIVIVLGPDFCKNGLIVST